MHLPIGPASDDPDFERKAADIIGLYLDPSQHAAVFCRRGWQAAAGRPVPFSGSLGLTKRSPTGRVGRVA
jgi:hypothetical protein